MIYSIICVCNPVSYGKRIQNNHHSFFEATMSKISIRFFNNTPVRAAWNDENSQWYFSVLDVISAIRKEPSYEKARNYWKYLKAKLKKEKSSPRNYTRGGVPLHELSAQSLSKQTASAY